VIEFRKEADGSVKRAKAWHGPEDLEGEKVADIAEWNVRLPRFLSTGGRRYG
jgi:hypothetical protein